MTPGYKHGSREQEFGWVKPQRELKVLGDPKKIILSFIQTHAFLSVTLLLFIYLQNTKNVMNMNEKIVKFN